MGHTSGEGEREMTPRIFDDGDGFITIDFDRANDDVISISISKDGLGWSAVVGEHRGFGVAPVTHMPAWALDALRSWATKEESLASSPVTRRHEE